jgi:hypothetical protein
MASARIKSSFRPTCLEQLEKHEQDCTPDESEEPVMTGDGHEKPRVIAHDVAVEDLRTRPEIEEPPDSHKATENIERVQQDLQMVRMIGIVTPTHEHVARQDDLQTDFNNSNTPLRGLTK